MYHEQGTILEDIEWKKNQFNKNLYLLCGLSLQFLTSLEVKKYTLLILYFVLCELQCRSVQWN
jgi:hypothetical protein